METALRVPAAGWIPIGAWAWTLIAAWTLFIGLALWWNMAHIDETVRDLAKATARSGFAKDLLYSEWVSMHGGVYVPVTDKNPPDPFLAGFPERDIATPSGRRLTLVSPSYMTRQVSALGKDRRTYFGRITSLNHIRRENAPDAWERKALAALERGETEAISVERIGGKLHLRLMSPLRVTAVCLKCHASNDYKEGGIHGGISVALPMKDYEAIVLPHQWEELFVHGVIWIFGLALLGTEGRQIRLRWREQDLVRKRPCAKARRGSTRPRRLPTSAVGSSTSLRIV